MIMIYGNGNINMRFDFYTPSEISQILGDRLKQRRLELNLTQKALAEKSGVGVSTVARIESGQGGTVDNLIHIAIALGMINEFAQLFVIPPASINDIIAKQTPRQRASSHK